MIIESNDEMANELVSKKQIKKLREKELIAAKIEK